MKFKNLFLASIIAMPFTFLEVSAAGNTDKLKDTIIDKTIQKFENGFNSLFTNTELTIEIRTDNDHKIEHTLEEFKTEMNLSELTIEQIITNWGEIWAICKTNNY